MPSGPGNMGLDYLCLFQVGGILGKGRHVTSESISKIGDGGKVLGTEA